ncbi:MAG TPA: hypothetical protein VE081_13990 [Sporichthyaceae bacterium]|nr:hypothetical protein [Sporichthyaceae bacterium]
MSSPNMTELQEENARIRERLATETAELAHRLDVKAQVAQRTAPARRRVSDVTLRVKQVAQTPAAVGLGAAGLAAVVMVVRERRR